MSESITRECPIYATPIYNEDLRRRSIYKEFGICAFQVEGYIFSQFRALCPEYDGGSWDFYELSNDGWFMAPRDKESYTLECEGNWYKGKVSAEAAGIIACLFIYGNILQDADKYWNLRDYACQHPEVEEILAAID